MNKNFEKEPVFPVLFSSIKSMNPSPSQCFFYALENLEVIRPDIDRVITEVIEVTE
jgi:hypothetical protein